MEKKSPSSTSISSIENDARNDSKNRNFHKAFRKKGIPDDEIVLEKYSCALQRDMLLLQGFLYVTRNYFCYYSNVVGFIHQVVIPVSKVKNIMKKNAALVVPNAIQIDTKTGESYFLLSFINRDSTYNLLFTLWEENKKTHNSNLIKKNEFRHKKSPSKIRRSSAIMIKNPSNNGDSHDNHGNSSLNDKNNVFMKVKNSVRLEDINIHDNEEEKITSPRKSSLSPTRHNRNNLRRSSKKHLRHTSLHRASFQEDFLDNEKVQNDIIFPSYIPKIKTIKEFRFVRLFLISTIFMVVFVTVISILIRIKVNYLSKEIKAMEEVSIYDLSSLTNKHKDKEKLKDLLTDNETLEKLKKMSESLGLTIPQLLNTNWNDYELVN